MDRKKRLILIAILGLIGLIVVIFSWLEYTGQTHLLADYYAPRYIYNLTDGDALSAQDIQKFIRRYNPNVENNVGLKLSYYCRKYQVNPAFVLGIAEADSAQGLAGAGRTNKNPGNTKISYSALNQAGIKHAWWKGASNFAVFKTWGDGYAAIALTLNNYRYYNLRGQIDPILRTYAGNPNPNYYATVRGVMNRLLSQINIRVQLTSRYSDKSLQGARVVLRREGKTIRTKRADKQGRVVFNNLPRARYALQIITKEYRKRRVGLNSPSQTNNLNIALMAKDRNYLAGRVQQLIMETPDNEGVMIRLSGEDGALVRKTKTSKNGFYYFGNLLPGKYVVSIESEVDLPTGFYYSKGVNLTKGPRTEADFIY